MRNDFCKTVKACAVVALILCSATLATAQCSRNTIRVGGIGIESGNPFVAELVTTSVMVAADGSKRPFTWFEYVARDSAGRVRIERFIRKLSPDASREEIAAARRHVAICDPVAGTFVSMDTGTHTAEVTEASDAAPALPRRRPFSISSFPPPGSKLPPDTRFEDLGHQLIEGLNVRGGRIISPVRVDERWVSDDLAAHLVQVYADPAKGTETRIALTRINRIEPDPALFVIPAGYSVRRTATKVSSEQ